MSCDIVPHIMDHGMVLDALPNPTQSSITTFQIFLNAGVIRSKDDRQLNAARDRHFSVPEKRNHG